MTKLNLQLVADLARLATKYPPDDWEGLLDYVRDPRRRDDLFVLLEQVASASRHRREPARQGRRSSERRPSIRDALARVGEADPARADLLNDIWSRLRQRELLSEMRTIREFADAVGLKGFAATKRDQAVTELMRYLVELPANDLVAMMKKTVASDRNLGQEYERWVELILGNPPVGQDGTKG